MKILTLTPHQLSQMLEGSPQQLQTSETVIEITADMLTKTQKKQLIEHGQTKHKSFLLLVRSAYIVPVVNKLAVKDKQPVRSKYKAPVVSALPERSQAALESSTNTVVYLSVDFENMPSSTEESLQELTQRVHQLSQIVEKLQEQNWTVSSDGQGGWQAHTRSDSLQQARSFASLFEGTSFQMFYRGRPV